MLETGGKLWLILLFLMSHLHLHKGAVLLEFTEPSYTGGESTSRVTVGVKLLTSADTTTVVEIVPVTLKFMRELQNLPSSFPEFPEDNPWQPAEALSNDFNTTRIPLQFETESAGAVKFIDIEIVDDDIHEVEQTFGLILELGDSDELDLRRSRFATLCKIADNDPITIGFEQEFYTVFEAFNATGQLTRIPIVKRNNQRSETTFVVAVSFVAGNSATEGADFIAQDWYRAIFNPDEQKINFPFILLRDQAPEGEEFFQIELSLGSDTPSVSVGGGGVYSRATVMIVDEDVVAIEFETREYTVQENNGTVTVCLTTDRGISEPLTVEVFTSSKINSKNPASIDDFMIQAQNITFPAASSGSRICPSFNIFDDHIREGNEQFQAGFIPPPLTQRGLNDVACITIIDDEPTPTPTPPPQSPSPKGGSVPTTVIIGGVVGGAIGGMLIVIILTVIVVAVLRRRKRVPKQEPVYYDKVGLPELPPRLQMNVSYNVVPMKGIKVDSTAVDSANTIQTQPNTAYVTSDNIQTVPNTAYASNLEMQEANLGE